ncbi:1-acyl-sn-glycerol-3-phosphate acyltransferase [Micrococcus sp. HG099]|uniref:lysophospholipid acyltransferase family protein n=1 Tax=Micrococcus sp. HG099 TaxID=2969755 RepID=UPI00215B4A73|nr:lysophospholipid acyltransferase family protein [Micrococcus sp. HG099]MCR8675821.1 1-acyl-sn-glycerol-3-phosphate acyltransferase [Micrococcus sp. HG099]
MDPQTPAPAAGRPSRAARAGYVIPAAIVRPALRGLVRQVWEGTENLPETGAILAVNHISELDPLSVAHMVYNQGLLPTFLAKAELWKVPVLKQVLEATRMIPVERTRDGGRSLDAAREAVATGRAIIVYPEGTVTRDPDGWPMAARSGAVRLALQTGAPLIPVGQWGIQELLPYGGRAPRPFPRKTARIRIGAPVDLDDLRGAPMTASGLRAGTERMMDAITVIVADLRGEPAPAGRWDPRTGRREPGA